MNLKVSSLLIAISLVFSIQTTFSAEVDNDGDGRPATVDCDDNNPLWHDDCTLTAFQGCTDANQRDFDCLPNISNVVLKLETLDEHLVGMRKDKHVWWDVDHRPGDNTPFSGSKRHVQSIQHIAFGEGKRYIVTSMSDEHHDIGASVQIIKTDKFGDEDGEYDKIVEQDVLGLSANSDFWRFNHPGGSQLIGNFLFLALEDFKTEGVSESEIGLPATGVWLVSDGMIEPAFIVPTTNTPPGDAPLYYDHHQSTAAVTKLTDETYLLAACVGAHGCDDINFYKSKGGDLLQPDDRQFEFVDSWNRYEWGWEPWWGLPYSEISWDQCAPQNMNFVADASGEIYLVMFGAVNEGIPKPGPGVKDLFSGCVNGLGYDDHLFVYKLGMNPGYEISLEFMTKVDVMPESHVCAPGLYILEHKLHGLNFLAGSGLWASPNGQDSIAILATEHYDSCGANERPVNAKTRWGVSSNWNQLQLLTIDNPTVTVNEGDIASNAGKFFDFGTTTLKATIGSVVPGAGAWNWSWQTADGPDDSQTVGITRKGFPFLPDTKTFDLIVNNVAPTARAGLDQVVECVHGESVSVDATGSTDPGADTLTFEWEFLQAPGSSAPAFDDPASAATSFLPNALGTYLAEVTVTDDDGASDTDDVTILFQDTTPPVISSFSATPDVLWPPNDKMVRIETSVSVTDACDPAPDCAITAIESDEPDEGATDSDITGPLTAKLRAKRLGTGDGRTYTITVECSDYASNSTTQTTVVTVPHDQDSVPE